MDTGMIISVIAVAIAAVSFMWHQFGLYAGIKERLTRLETKVDLFWGMVEDKLSDMLHSPDHKTKDELLCKLKKKCLTRDEAIELKFILEEESQREDKNPLSLAYFLVITRLEVLIADLNRR